MLRYALIQRLLHWLIALIALGVLAIGLTLGILKFEGTKATFGMPATNALYEYHKTFGLILFGLMLLRLFVRLEYGKPPIEGLVAPWERIASAVVQYLLYLALIAQPILGWLATDAADFPVQFFHWNLPQIIDKSDAAKRMGEALYAAHGVVGWSILALLTLHIGGALKHLLVDRSGVTRRMGLF